MSLLNRARICLSLGGYRDRCFRSSGRRAGDLRIASEGGACCGFGYQRDGLTSITSCRSRLLR